MGINKYLRRGALAVAAVAVSGGCLVIGGAGSAWASNTQVSVVGSATTFQIMHDLFPTSFNDINPDSLAAGQTETIVPDSQTCTGGITYSSTNQPPNGSGAGKSALAAEQGAPLTTQGCIDLSRSSSPPAPHTEVLPSGTTKGGDPAGSNLDYYAFALDGVDALVGANAMANGNSQSQNLENPVVLTLQQIKNIYSCWNPATSFTSGSLTAPNEENSEDGIVYLNSLTGAAHEPIADAISIYSAGKYVQSFNDKAAFNATANNVVVQELTGSTNTVGNFNPSLTLVQVTNGSTQLPAPYVTYGAQTGIFNPNTNRGSEAINPATVTESNEWYSHLPATTGANPSDSTAPVPGIRYVYSATDTKLPGYNGAKAMVGFDNQVNGTPSSLCKGNDSATIISDGFLPLGGNATAPAGSDKANVACREFPGLSFPDQGGSIAWTTGTWPQP